jgi:ribosomal protein S12 methylthiotransferase accessory factor
MTAASSYRILDLWSDLVDSHTGIVREVRELLVDDDEPPFVHYLSTTSSTEAFGFLPNFGSNGGVGLNAQTAIAKALGEAVERYCSAMFSYDDLVWAPYSALGEPATPPASFTLYSAAQYALPAFPWQRFDPDSSTVGWVRGRSLVTGRDILVPAAFVYVPYHYQRSRGEIPIAQPISTGLACGDSLEEATLSALCEVIERDAFTITWQAMLRRNRISLHDLPDDLLDIVRRYHSVGLSVHLADITTDVACPTVLSVAEGFAPTSPAVAVAAAAHPIASVAARKSLEELAHTRKYAAQVMDYLPPVGVDIAGGHPEVDGQRAHLRFYCPQEAKDAASFLWSGEAEVPLPDPDPATDVRLDTLIAEVAATGEDVVAVDLTAPDIADVGLHVVRVVVPGFHPLHMGHLNRCLGGQRLRTVPARFGAEGFSAEHDNPYPHPFP